MFGHIFNIFSNDFNKFVKYITSCRRAYHDGLLFNLCRCRRNGKLRTNLLTSENTWNGEANTKRIQTQSTSSLIHFSTWARNDLITDDTILFCDRTHTGFKPLKCKYCYRPFGDPSNLNKHVRLHAEGDTPYKYVHKTWRYNIHIYINIYTYNIQKLLSIVIVIANRVL